MLRPIYISECCLEPSQRMANARLRLRVSLLVPPSKLNLCKKNYGYSDSWLRVLVCVLGYCPH